MGIFDRFSRLVKSNANAAAGAVGKLQDTGKEVEQLVIEMEEALRKARRETTESMAAHKLAENRVAAAEREVAQWDRRAEEAVRAGDDDLAREALARAGEKKTALADTRREALEAARTSAARQEGLKRLEAKLREVKARKGTIKAKVALGKQQGLSSDAMDEFERMADRIDDSESQGEAEGELAEVLGRTPARAETEAKLARLDGGDVDSRLAALKKKLEDR
jgi:phage shock protein A